MTFASLSLGSPKVTSESFFRVFKIFGVSGSEGLLPGYKTIFMCMFLVA